MPIDLARRLTMEGLLTDDQFAAVVARRASTAEPVPVALEAMRIPCADAIASMFDRLGFVPAQKLESSTNVRVLPRGLLRALWALPIGESPLGVVVALTDPTDRHALAELAYHLRKPVDPRWAPVEALRRVVADADPGLPAQSARTRPAGAPPPPSDGEEDPVVRIPPAAMAAEVMALVGRGPRRLATPAYGQPRPDLPRTGPRAAATRTETPLGHAGSVAASSRPIATAPGGISSFHGTYDGPAIAATEGIVAPPTGARDSEAPIPLRRRPRSTAMPPAPTANVAPHEALYALAELRAAPDRDAIARIAAVGMTTASQRAAFFVVKRGVVQGWEGATLEATPGAGLSREALRNLWIPVTTPSVFRVVSERTAMYIGPLSDSTADSILAAALGGRPTTVLNAPIIVRGKVVGFLYADGLADSKNAARRAEELANGAAEALERVLTKKRDR